MKDLNFYVKVTQITKIKVIGSRESWYYYIPEKQRKILWFCYKIIPAHFESGLNFNFNYSAEDIENVFDEFGQKIYFIDYKDINNPIVYYRPKVELIIKNEEIVKRFDTFEEAQEWAKNLIDDYSLNEDILRIV